MKFVSKSIENRIENLDFIRGVAILGILIMNSMVFALPESANWNHSSSGADSYFDWILIFFAVIFIDGKMMGLFSDSAKKKGYKRPVMLSLWRNLLLLLFGILHIIFMFVFIDILFLYALLSPIILFLRNRNIYILIAINIIVISILLFSLMPSFPMRGRRRCQLYPKKFPRTMGGHWRSGAHTKSVS